MCLIKYTIDDLIEDKLYQVIDQFNERKIPPLTFYSMLLNEINPFYDGNGWTSKILLLMMIKSRFMDETET